MVQVSEYYWGYGSGIVVTKVSDYGEFVLAELTRPVDQGDLAYFFPLMHHVEESLGYRPRYGTFDAWYVYGYFHGENDPPDRYAAVPFAEQGGYKANIRQFSSDGLPLCAAGLLMALQFTFTNRTNCLVEHERGKYVCPLRFPLLIGQKCPIRHTN